MGRRVVQRGAVPRTPLTCIIHDGSLQRHSFCLKIWKIRTAPSL